MTARASILRMMLAGGLALGVSGCGYVENLLEDDVTTDPANVGTLDAGKAADYGAAATALGLVDGLVEDFGSGVGNVAKAGGPLLAPVTGPDCPLFDIVGFDPNAYPPGAPLPDTVTMTADYTHSTQPCLDQDGNALSGTYAVVITGLTDETWPATVDDGLGGFTDVYHWRFADATLDYTFTDMQAQLPAVTTTTNGELKVHVTTDGAGATSKAATNVGDIRTVFDDGNVALAALLNRTDVTKVLPAGSSVSTTDGDFRLTVALFGYIDVHLIAVVVDEAACPHHPTSGVVTLTGSGGDVVSLNFTDTDPFACDEADVTLADGTVAPDQVIPNIF